MPEGPAPTIATTRGVPFAELRIELRAPLASTDRYRFVGRFAGGLRGRLAAAAVGPAIAPARVTPTGVTGAAVGLPLGLHRHVVQLHPSSVAVRALGAERLQQPGADPLAGHLHQAEAGDLGDLVPGPVPSQALDQSAQQQLAVAGQHHVDEVDHDDAADVAQPKLPDDLLGSFQVVLGDRLLEVAPGAGELAGVDVDDRHRLGPVDDQRATRGQPDLAVQRLLDLL